MILSSCTVSYPKPRDLSWSIYLSIHPSIHLFRISVHVIVLSVFFPLYLWITLRWFYEDFRLRSAKPFLHPLWALGTGTDASVKDDFVLGDKGPWQAGAPIYDVCGRYNFWEWNIAMKNPLRRFVAGNVISEWGFSIAKFDCQRVSRYHIHSWMGLDLGGIQQAFPSKSMLQYSLKIMKTTSGLQAHTDPPATCVRRCFATSGCNVFVWGVYLKHLKAPQDASANNGTL